jgi:hypothetical protein
VQPAVQREGKEYERFETQLEQGGSGAAREMTCTAMYDYTAKFADELSFRVISPSFLPLSPLVTFLEALVALASPSLPTAGFSKPF